ncbi:MAG: TIGR02147 family protein [Bacteriovoracaceae bacterium]|nr:TIGR02147 family protein [Bacteriovoracaceae bacterium]
MDSLPNKALDLKSDRTGIYMLEGTGADNFREVLQTELLTRCKNNRAYSLRSYAKSLEIDPSVLSKILNGKRVIGEKLVKRLGSRLGLSPEEMQDLMPSAREVSSPKDSEYLRLSIDSFEIMANWYHYAILELMELPHFKSDPKWVANTLGITTSEVNLARERLIRVGILEITKDGQWVELTDGKMTTIGNEFSSGAFRKLQRDILQKALDALEETPMQERDQTSMTFSIDSQKLPKAREMIKDFRRTLARFLGKSKTKDRVYHLGISLYPVSKKMEQK